MLSLKKSPFPLLPNIMDEPLNVGIMVFVTPLFFYGDPPLSCNPELLQALGIEPPIIQPMCGVLRVGLTLQSVWCAVYYV